MASKKQMTGPRQPAGARVPLAVKRLNTDMPWQEVRIGGTEVTIKDDDGKIKGSRVLGATYMKMRAHPERDDYQIWLIPELAEQYGEFTLSPIAPIELIRQEIVPDPLRGQLGDWLAEGVRAKAMITRKPEDLSEEDATRWQAANEWWAEHRAECFEAVALASIVHPRPLADKPQPGSVEEQQEQNGEAIWVKRIPLNRLFQLWMFVNMDLAELQVYFR